MLERLGRFPWRARRALAVLGLAWLGLAAGAAPAEAQEVANVEVAGSPVFTVTTTGAQSAAERAREFSDRFSRRVESGEALAPIRAMRTDSGYVLVVAGTPLALVTQADAEVAAGQPLRGGAADAGMRRVADEWARSLQLAFSRATAGEKARVVVEGNPLFEVTGTPELRARRRAAAIAVRITELAARPGEPPPLRAERRGEGAAVLAAGEVLAEVTPADAAMSGTPPLALARDWAASVRRTVDMLQRQGTWAYTLRLVGVALLALLIACGLHRVLRMLAARVERRSSPDPARPAWGLLPVLALWGVSVLQFIVWLAVGAFVIWLIPSTKPIAFGAGQQAVSLVTRIVRWLVTDGLVVLLIVVATLFFARFAGLLVRQLLLALGARQGGRTALRAETLAGTAAGAAHIVVGFIGLVVVLEQMRIDPLPLLASAGVAGIALGFGVQTLIRDFFTGMFILLEDQYGVGDVVKIGDVSGTVERLTLRITQVRAMDGSLTSIPNGGITTVTNSSKDYGQVVLDVNIALGEDVDRATELIERTARELAEEWGERIEGEPRVLGVETVDPLAQAVTLRMVLRTPPAERWNVTRELRLRILRAFREAEIQVPPRSVVTLPRPGAPGA